MFILLLVAVLVVFKIVFYVYCLVVSRLRLAAIPQPPLDSWFYGHKPSMDKAKVENRFLDMFIEWVATYGDTTLFWIRIRPFIFTCNPDMMQQVTTDLTSFKKVVNLPNRSLYEQHIVGYDSILSGGGMKWALKRKIMTKFFAKVNMEQVFNKCKPHMETTQLARLKAVVGAGEQVEMIHQLGIIFTSYIHVLGLDGLFTAEKVAANVTKILELIPLQLGVSMKSIKLMLSGDKAKAVIMIKEMRTRIKELTMDKMEEMKTMEENELDQTDILRFLIEANKSKITAGGMTQNTITEHLEGVTNDVMTVCLVMDNLVKQIGSLFIFLKDVPDVQQKMFEELRSHPITDYDSLGQLEYTEKCLLESLRMAPALLRGTRLYKADSLRFGPYKLATNKVQIFYSQYVMHYNEQHWENPKQFDPERWSNGFTPAPYSYMPFLVGPRSCIGKYMAMMMMKLTLSILTYNFDFTARFDTRAPPAVDQAMAVMRIRNKIDYYLTPAKKN